MDDPLYNVTMRIFGKRVLGAIVVLQTTLILSLLQAGALAAPSGGKNFLWKASSDSGVVYILGSIHFFKSELYPLDEKIDKAFGMSDVLAVEADINNIGEISPMKLLERSLYPEGDSIEKHVSAGTMAFLKESLERTGMPPALFRVQKPWFIALTLTSLELMRLGFDPQYGIDNHFLSEALGKKKVVELESMEYQIDLLSGLSDDEQEAFLLYTLRDLRTIDREADKLLGAWQTGNATAMEEIAIKSAGSDAAMSGFLEKILYERNRNMASKIVGFLETKKTHFVVVGAAHLVGEKGILEILRSKGYSVEQM
jgi:hypothetical protein